MEPNLTGSPAQQVSLSPVRNPLAVNDVTNSQNQTYSHRDIDIRQSHALPANGI